MKTVEVRSEMTGNVWKVLVQPGQAVGQDEDIAILESMKMEIPVASPHAGTVASIAIEEGGSVSEGDLILVLEIG